VKKRGGANHDSSAGGLNQFYSYYRGQSSAVVY
jgi:hypothetical protein